MTSFSYRNVLVCTSLLPWLLLSLLSLQGVHVNGSVPLPNPIESPHLKNQSLIDCSSKHDPTLSIKGFPNNPKCQDKVLIKAQFTPQYNVLSLVCYGKIYLNGEVLVAKSTANACSKIPHPSKCPMIKGELQEVTFQFPGFPCFVSTGHYRATGSCTNQDDVELGCLEWSFTWV